MPFNGIGFIRKYVFLRVELGILAAVQIGQFECNGIMHPSFMPYIHQYELAIPITDCLEIKAVVLHAGEISLCIEDWLIP